MKRLLSRLVASLAAAILAVGGGCDEDGDDASQPPEKNARWKGVDSGYQDETPSPDSAPGGRSVEGR